MAKLMESTKKNRIYLRKMFKGMGYDSFLDGFSESFQTNKGCFYLESIDFGEHEISNSDTDSNEKLTLNFRGDENSIPDMILRISNFFDKNNITIKHTIKEENENNINKNTSNGDRTSSGYDWNAYGSLLLSTKSKLYWFYWIITVHYSDFYVL